MKVKRIKVKNYKSFSNIGIDYELNDGLNILVGENNSGKTNTLTIIRQIIMCLEDPSFRFIKEDFFETNQGKKIYFEIEIFLQDQDIVSFMNSLDLMDKHKDDFNEIFGKSILIDISSSALVPIISIKMNNLFIDNYDENNIRLYTSNYIKNSNNQTEVLWGNIIQEMRTKDVSLKTCIFNYLVNNNSTIILLNNFYSILANLLKKNIVSFSEFRERPNETDSLYMISKRNIAKVLSELKNGELHQRDKFDEIQKRFSDMFPNFTLETFGISDPKIVIVRNGKNYEVSHHAIGAGIFEMINILTHLIGTKDKLLLFDEPEIHLHPHAQRMLSMDINNNSKTNQILCVTHSPIFVHLNNLDSIRIIRNVNGETNLIKFESDLLDQNNQSSDQMKRIKERIMTSEQKEFLFARKVILVEGPTEFGAIPIISKKIDIDLDRLGISIIDNGNNEFDSFIRLLKSMDIKYHVITDRDTLIQVKESMEIDRMKIRVSTLIKQLDKLRYLDSEDLDLIKSMEKNKQKHINQNKKEIIIYDESVFEKLSQLALKHNFHVLSSDFEGIYKKNNCESIIKEAKNEFANSKVLQGKYFAKKCNVPTELRDIIEKII